MSSSTKKLLLMRHAKSSWTNHGLKDFDRPLNKRGKKDAPRMGRYLKELQLMPKQIFSSPAVRAKSTTLKVIRELGLPANAVTWNENLYFEGTEWYLNAIRSADDQSEVVMIVGHNPMTEDIISQLSSHSSNITVKTATIACFEFEADSWKDINLGKETLKWIVGPKDLK